MGPCRDVIDVLIDDHRLLEELLDRLDREDRPAEMRVLFLRIAQELAAHETAEHHVVFPAAAALPTPGDELLHLAAEHDEANSLLAEMLGLDPAGLGFAKRASALALELRAHFAAEEELLFPCLRSALDHAALVRLAGDVRTVKHSAPVFPVARGLPLRLPAVRLGARGR
jgi:hemerythrin superfamily protein